MREGEEVSLEIYDRIAMGDQLMMFRWPGKEEGRFIFLFFSVYFKIIGMFFSSTFCCIYSHISYILCLINI